MEEAFEHKGVWWLPETPDNEKPGTLIYSPDEGVRLEIQGVLHAPSDGQFHPPTFHNVPLILGVTTKGEEVSLLDCIQIKGNVNIGEYIGVPETGYRINRAFIGMHFPSPNPTFSKLSMRFTHLDDWFDQKPFQVDYPPITTEYPGIHEVSIYYKKTMELKAEVSAYILSFVAAGPSINHLSAGELLISQKAWVTIQSVVGEKSLEDFTNMMRRIQDFLTLGVGEPVYPIEVVGYCDANKKVFENGKEYQPPIQIFYALPWQSKPEKRVYPMNMLFTLKTLHDQMEISLKRWFNQAENLKPVLDIYFSLLYREQIYSEFRFLGIVQSIETYHRRIWGGKYMQDDIFLTELYPKLVQSIPPGLDPGFKQSLKTGKLRYANEYSLRKRLHDLACHLTEYLPLQFLNDNVERDAFIDKVCNTRNYLTHYEPGLKENAAITGKELYELYKKLRVLVDALLLEEIGFEKEQIREMIKKNEYYVDLFNVPEQ